MIKFGYTIIYVENVGKSVEFYEKVFGLMPRFVHESGEYAELETGQTTLAFAAEKIAKENLGKEFQKNSLKNTPAGIEIALIANDVEKAYNHAVSSGAIAVASPSTKPWGQTVAFVRDLNGVVVEICSPIEV
jgi:uncharacterized glyoxalase superfamily protein PhnB